MMILNMDVLRSGTKFVFFGHLQRSYVVLEDFTMDACGAGYLQDANGLHLVHQVDDGDCFAERGTQSIILCFRATEGYVGL